LWNWIDRGTHRLLGGTQELFAGTHKLIRGSLRSKRKFFGQKTSQVRKADLGPLLFARCKFNLLVNTSRTADWKLVKEEDNLMKGKERGPRSAFLN
jgi:hypothetical protein